MSNAGESGDPQGMNAATIAGSPNLNNNSNKWGRGVGDQGLQKVSEAITSVGERVVDGVKQAVQEESQHYQPLLFLLLLSIPISGLLYYHYTTLCEKFFGPLGHGTVIVVSLVYLVFGAPGKNYRQFQENQRLAKERRAQKKREKEEEHAKQDELDGEQASGDTDDKKSKNRFLSWFTGLGGKKRKAEKEN